MAFVPPHHFHQYITLENLALLLEWFRVNQPHSMSIMLSGIDRDGDLYVVHTTRATHGFEQKFRIQDGVVTREGDAVVWEI